MAGIRDQESSKLTSLINDVDELLHPSDVLDSFWDPGSFPSFHGSETMVNFDCGVTNASKTFFHAVEEEEFGEMEDCSGSCFPLSGRKRRLTAGQVQLLERNFENENKLEPGRKVRIAKELGLQPRQVSIWFQNRRARFKIKQLEKDYESLKASHDSLKANYECLVKENSRLKLEVLSLKDKLPMKDVKKLPDIPLELFVENCKHQEDAISAKSDVFDSESPKFMDPANYSYESCRLVGPLLQLPKLEEHNYHDLSSAADLDDHPFWHWSY